MTATAANPAVDARSGPTGDSDPAAPSAPAMLLPALCVASFLGTLLFASLSPFFPDISRDLDVSVPALGQVVTTRLVLSSVLGLAVGPLADRYGFRWIMVAGMATAALTFFWSGLAPSYVVLLGASLPGGLSGAILGGLSLAIAGTRFHGEERRRAMSWTVASLASAPIVGVPILTTAGSVVGWRAVFVASGVVALGATWFVGRHLPDDATRAGAPLDLRGLVDAYRPLFRHRPTVRLFGVTIVRGIGWLGFLTYYGAFLDEEVGMSTRQIGLFYMAGGTAYFLGSLTAGRWFTGASPVRLVAAMNAAMGICMLLALNIPSSPPAVVVATAAVAFTGAVGWVVFTTLLAGTTPAGAGTTMVFNASLLSLGSALGGGIGALLIALGGYRGLGLGLSLFLFVGAWLVTTQEHGPTGR